MNFFLIKHINSNLVYIKKFNEKGNKNVGEKETLHRKSGNVSDKLNLYLYLESYPSDGYDTHNLNKHQNLDDDMESCDNTYVQFLQKLHFYINVLKFFLGCIPGFDAKITAINTEVDDNPSNPKWNVSKIVPIKILITQHQYRFQLRQMKKMIYNPVKKKRIHQFHVGYMTHPMLKKHSTHKEQVMIF